MRPLIRSQYSVCIIENKTLQLNNFLSVFIGYEKLTRQASNIAQYKTQQECYNKENMHQIPSSKSYKTNFWSMFNSCLPYFQGGKFFYESCLERENYVKKYDTANDYVPKGIFLFHKRM